MRYLEFYTDTNCFKRFLQNIGLGVSIKYHVYQAKM